MSGIGDPRRRIDCGVGCRIHPGRIDALHADCVGAGQATRTRGATIVCATAFNFVESDCPRYRCRKERRSRRRRFREHQEQSSRLESQRHGRTGRRWREESPDPTQAARTRGGRQKSPDRVKAEAGRLHEGFGGDAASQGGRAKFGIGIKSRGEDDAGPRPYLAATPVASSPLSQPAECASGAPEAVLCYVIAYGQKML